ncbi:MAG: oligosaccharide flippase family protein [Chloroflexota bacterium]|nr:oligosaccharide flippase family protein [Chloroflexota bacterium]
MSVKSVSKSSKPLVERAGWAVFWNVAFFPLKVLLPFAASIVTVRLLRTNGFAVLSFATALLNFLGLFSDLGIERTLPRFYPEIEMRFGRGGVSRLLLWVTVVKGVVLLCLVGALAIAPGYWISAWHLGPSGGLILTFIGGLLVLGAASDVSIQFLYAHFRQKTTNALDVLSAVAYPGLTVLFVLAGMGAVGAILALLLTTALSVVLSVWQAWTLLRVMSHEPHARAAEVKLPSSHSLRRRLFFFSGLNYLVNWSVYLYDLPFIVTMLGLLVISSPERQVEVALITVAYKLTKHFLRALVVPLTGVQTPLFARLYAEGRIEGLRTAYATLSKFLILALMPAGVGLIVTARNVFQIFYGEVGRDAVVTSATLSRVVACAVILTFGLFGESMISIALNVLIVYEDYRSAITARLVALVSIPLLVLLVPPFGVVGAAIAVAVAGIGSRLLAVVYGHRHLQLYFPGVFFVRVGWASILMGFCLLPFLLLPANIPATAAMLALGAAVFLASFKLLGGLDEADKERFRTLRIPFADKALRFL